MSLVEYFTNNKEIIENCIQNINSEEKILILISNVAKSDNEYILNSYLALYIYLYGYDNTLNFIKSRLMWEGKGNIDSSKKRILLNLSLYLNDYRKNSSALTLKPLFGLI